MKQTVRNMVDVNRRKAWFINFKAYQVVLQSMSSLDCRAKAAPKDSTTQVALQSARTVLSDVARNIEDKMYDRGGAHHV